MPRPVHINSSPMPTQENFTGNIIPDVRRASARTPRTLHFREFTMGDVPSLLPVLAQAPGRTCDFTIGGIYMWIEYFGYKMCLLDDTLFVRGLNEANTAMPAFSLPVGLMPLGEAMELLKRYCADHGMPLMLSAVPEVRVEELVRLGATRVEPLEQWADYLYDIRSLATFAGKKLNRKRNHINRFLADHPGYTAMPLTPANASQAIDLLARLHRDGQQSEMAGFERAQVRDVLAHLGSYPFEGMIVSVPGRGPVAFTVGEVIGDTLYAHIEKMDHEVTGAGEIVCRDFAAMMLARHPALRYENREDDAGDPGLRQAKQALNPLQLLRKYNVTF